MEDAEPLEEMGLLWRNNLTGTPAPEEDMTPVCMRYVFLAPAPPEDTDMASPDTPTAGRTTGNANTTLCEDDVTGID